MQPKCLIPRGLVLLGWLFAASGFAACDFVRLVSVPAFADGKGIFSVRPVREDDLAPLGDAFRQAEVQQGGSIFVRSADADVLVHGGSSPTDTNWVILNRTIVDRRSGKVVGAIQIGRKHVHSMPEYQAKPDEKVAQILFVMDPGRTGSQVIEISAPEIERAFKELGLSRLVTRVPVRAAVLQSALKQLGFRRLSLSLDGLTEYFELRPKDFQPAAAPAARPWIRKASEVSPPEWDPVMDEVDKALVPFSPPWERDPVELPGAGPFAPMEAKEFDPDLILIPQSARLEIEHLVMEMDQAPSYTDGIRLLRDYMTQVGLIQSYEVLRLLHASHVRPGKIMRDGILSSQELKARGEPHSRWGQNMGDGVYTVGVEGWEGVDDWGTNQYEIVIPKARIFMGNNLLAGAFVKIYDSYREKWKLPRFDDDTLRAPGLPEGVFSFNGRLARLPSFFTDLGVIGASSHLEILLKTRRIPPSQIRVLPPLRE